MQKISMRRLLAGAAVTILPAGAMAADLEVTHWWTSGGEAAAVQELARIFEEQTEHGWVDGAIAGSGSTARPIMVSRIIGGDPMGATQFNHGLQAQELVEAGLMQDLTEVAEANGWRDTINPVSLLDACTFEGRVYCAPLNIHSPQWMWTSLSAFEKAGVEPATNWEELKAAAPALREAGILPLAQGMQGWQTALLLYAMISGIGGADFYNQVFAERNEDALNSDTLKNIFAEYAIARDLASGGNLSDWNMATNRIIEGTAAAQVMGDWAQGEFALAGKSAGTDYGCHIGLGGEPVIATGGDAIYFPVNDDEAVTEAQRALAQVILSEEAQVAFNAAKGSLPVRGDIDLAEVNECTKAGLETLKAGNTIPTIDLVMSSDSRGQIEDLTAEFFGSDLSAEDAHARFVEIVQSAM
ncbi:ABC transporter substrate-binding protein [Paracoccus sp. WLY502]|uniref:ABC transporter substrate-binding protein n=1 Tax=Paracoccus yibinensis TaxID=3068891 RepID=UPI002796C958|nr:ABC transporter substrate-binding protein [Paracoccus sp. WLY502]MDQ1901866.1 ABC transporter substrate-binding protein [Paracoccus sp. WLY502]